MKYLLTAVFCFFNILFSSSDVFSQNFEQPPSTIFNGEDSLNKKEKYNPNQHRFFVQVGYTALASISLWGDSFSNSGLNLKLGNRFFLNKQSSNGDIALQLSWFSFTDYFSKAPFKVVNSISILGVGPVYILDLPKNWNIELGLTANPYYEAFRTNTTNRNRSYGLMLSPEARIGYNRMYVNVNSGLSITLGDGLLYGAFIGLNLGVYL